MTPYGIISQQSGIEVNAMLFINSAHHHEFGRYFRENRWVGFSAHDYITVLIHFNIDNHSRIIVAVS